MKGKKFIDLLTGNMVEVKDSFEDIIILTDSSKIKINRLLDKNFYDEYIDPTTFFKNDNLLNSFTDKIRQIPNEIVQSMNESIDTNNLSGSTSLKPMMNESAVYLADPEAEKRELMEKYGIKDNAVSEANKQMEKFKHLLEDPEDPQNVQKVEVIRSEEPIQKIEVNRDVIEDDNPHYKPSKNEHRHIEDPIITMFRNVKRNKEFKITLDIENKIPRPDFIEMMEDSYNTSIIEFLADEFTNELLNNPKLIKDKILAEINKIVYGEIKKEPVKPKTTRKKATIKE